MRLPSDTAQRLGRPTSLGVTCDPAGRVSSGFDWGWGGTAYPPPGYLPWRALEVGNGDTYGFYWPIGREDGPPVAATLMHDEWAVLPLAGGLAACVRLHVLTGAGGAEDEWLDLARELGVPTGDLASLADRAQAEPDDDHPDGLPYWGPWDADRLLEIDPGSPHLRLLAAKRAVADRRLELAESHLLQALAALPEYSEALSLLALVYRQAGRHADSAGAIMQAITAPCCFGAAPADRRRLLGWLSRMKDTTYTGPDPLWPRRAELTLADDGDSPADYAILEDLIESYHAARLGDRAVRLRVTLGEMMSRETAAFQQRAKWNGEQWREQLASDLERAGITRAL